MNRIVFALAGSTAVIGLLLLVAPKEISEKSDATLDSPARTSPREARVQIEEPRVPEQPVALENLPMPAETEPPENSITESATHTITSVTHAAAEFSAAKLENIVLTADGFTLGTESADPQGDYRFKGVLQSPEETADERFTFYKSGYQGTAPPGSAVTFELRTKSVHGKWSDWIDATGSNSDLSQMLDFPAVAWQYRFTLSANDPGALPLVQNMTFAPEKTKPANLSQAGNDSEK